MRYVAPAGLCGAVAPCYAHPQAAIDAASAGDEIRVAAGVYAGVISRGGTMQAAYVDKSITLRGGYRLADWVLDPANNPTTLDAQSQGRVLTISGDIAPVIEGFRLTRGAAANGGGVYIQTAAATLRNNDVYSNTAESRGAGIYLDNSRATLSANRVYSNTTGSSGRGGGVATVNSPAILSDNVITANHAHAGGGVELANYNVGSGALLQSNIIRDNTAFDRVVGSTTYDGAGGGVYIGGREADTLLSNTISENTAKRGAGLNIDNAPAVIADNRIEQNQAGVHGGGLYVQGNQPTIRDNRVLMNTAASLGGGLYLSAAATVRDNLLQGNVAGYGGGLYGWYGQSATTLDGNRFLSNTATAQGGGAYLYRDSDATYRNNVFVANQAAQGGALYLSGATSHFIHSTIASNSSTDGRGVVIDRYPGLVNPGAPDQFPTSVAFTNTIFAGHAVAIFATAGNTLSVDGVLWHDTGTPIDAPGATTTRQHEFTGDPRFAADGYHLRPGASAALDRGSPIDNNRDVDGQLRPMGGGRDLGADEQMPSVPVGPAIGGGLNFMEPDGAGRDHRDGAAWRLYVSCRPAACTLPSSAHSNHGSDHQWPEYHWPAISHRSSGERPAAAHAHGKRSTHRDARLRRHGAGWPNWWYRAARSAEESRNRGLGRHVSTPRSWLRTSEQSGRTCVLSPFVSDWRGSAVRPVCISRGSRTLPCD